VRLASEPASWEEIPVEEAHLMLIRRGRTLVRTLAAATLLAGACSSVTAPDGVSGRSILFIGNSLTYVNDLPAMVAKVAEAADNSIQVAMVAGPNLAVIDHVNGATDAVAEIRRGGWSFVVLQQGPTPAGVCRDTLVIAAMRLAPHITRAEARAALFLPWARRQYPQSLESAGQSAGLAALAVGGVVVPIGIAWRDALRADAAAPLYGPDGYHPAPAGTLLAALTLYDRLFGRDVRDIPVESLANLSAVPLTATQVRVLAAAAHSASESWPADSPTPVTVDTTTASAGPGPC
jgi:hypothetical protein